MVVTLSGEVALLVFSANIDVFGHHALSQATVAEGNGSPVGPPSHPLAPHADSVSDILQHLKWHCTPMLRHLNRNTNDYLNHRKTENQTSMNELYLKDCSQQSMMRL